MKKTNFTGFSEAIIKLFNEITYIVRIIVDTAVSPADPGGGESNHIRSVNWTWPPESKILQHKNGTHFSFYLLCLLSTSLNFLTHNN